MTVYRFLIFLILLILSVWDIRYKKLPAAMLLTGAGITGLYMVKCIISSATVLQGAAVFMSFLPGIIPGLVMTVFSYLSDRVGRGDGIVIMIAGAAESWTYSMSLTCLACILLSVPSVFLLVLGRVHKNTHMPFIPFVAASYLIMWLLMTQKIGGISL